MSRNNFFRGPVSLWAVPLLAAFSGTSHAHGGGSGVDTDTCRVLVGSHWVHFTAYQPQVAGTTEYCKNIPQAGQATVVFDYEGKALRRMTVEFEITREPEGTRIHYQPPATHPSGSTHAAINFPEPGNYLGHITLVNGGQRVDAHVPFSVGMAPAASIPAVVWIVAGLALPVAYFLYSSKGLFRPPSNRQKDAAPLG